MRLDLLVYVSRPAGFLLQRSVGPVTPRRKWNKYWSVGVMECYFLSRPIDARGGPVRHHIWRERSLFELKKSINDQAIVVRIKSDFQQLRWRRSRGEC